MSGSAAVVDNISLPDEPVPPGPDRGPRRRLDLAAVYTVVFAGAGWAVGLLRLSDNSFLWHLRTGEYILDHGFPHADIYSFTAPGTKWVLQSWLAEVTYGSLDRAFGAFSIRILGALLTAAVLVIVYRLAYRGARDAQRAAGLTLLFLLCLYFSWSNRPLLFGFVFFAAVVFIVEVPDSWAGRHAVWLLPPILWLWANTHGSFVLGYLFLGLHLLGTWWDDGEAPWRGWSRSLLVGAGVALPLILLNPYGVDLLLFPAELVGRGDMLQRVVEWQSPNFRGDVGIAFGITLAVVVLIAARGPHRFSRRDLLVLLPFVGLAFWAQRNVPLAAVVMVAVAACALRRDVPSTRSEPRFLPVFVAVMVLVAVLFTVAAAGEPNFDYRRYPVKSLAWADAHGLLGPETHLLADDIAAGYVIARYWPHQRVFMDDRFDMYPIPVMRDYLALLDGSPKWASILDRYRIDTIVWPRGTPLTTLLEVSSAWKRVRSDARAEVFVRR